MIRAGVVLLTLSLWSVFGQGAERPNILWLTSEDNGPFLGCYGHPDAQTPHLDRLAAQGVRYRNAFANGPVCSTSRSTLVAGMYATTLGVQHHRSKVRIPSGFRLYPELLRAAGYYCTNNSKTDYNIAVDLGRIWDENGRNAHYRKRAPGQPFFAIFNLTTSHESQVAPKPDKKSFRVPPERVTLPPYHPDTPEVRRDWANYHDQVTAMDRQMGKFLADLEKDGLHENTIVFYFSDHAGALPRGKRNIHDSGTRIPLIVRIPDRWAQWAPARPGGWVEDPIALVDLPPTLFSFGGIETPAHYQGAAFLGPKRVAPRKFVYLYRDRMGERGDTSRSIRAADVRYVRNFAPHRPWGQYNDYAFEFLPSMRSWFEEFQAGRCNAVQAEYWVRRKPEELYRQADDPHEVRNLAADPAQATRLAELRQKLRQHLIATRDTGFIPEGMFSRLAAGKTIYEYAQSDAYPITEIVAIAEKATVGDPALLPDLRAALDSPHPVVRYWAATGGLVLREKAHPLRARLRELLADEWPDVRIVAAEALGWQGEIEASLATLEELVKSREPYVVLAALNTLDYLRETKLVSVSRVHEIVRDLKVNDPASRIQEYLIGLR